MDDIKRTNGQLVQLQRLPLEVKIRKSKIRIREWYEYYNGQVYVAYSGGKDSTVLLDIVRSMYPEVKAVFCDTGLEFPEIRQFVKSTENVKWLKPKLTFKEVLEKYGYPVISKEQAQFLYEFRTTKSDKLKATRWFGNKWNRGKISKKWRHMINADFKISHKCCDIMKKNPSKDFEKKTGLKPFVGTMTSESALRNQGWLRYGCNAFDNKRPTSKPMSFWTEDDVWGYLKLKELEYCKIYDMGYERTGCMFCMFGLQHEEEGNTRFDKLKKSHPKVYDFCMNDLGMEHIIDFIFQK